MKLSTLALLNCLELTASVFDIGPPHRTDRKPALRGILKQKRKSTRTRAKPKKVKIRVHLMGLHWSPCAIVMYLCVALRHTDEKSFVKVSQVRWCILMIVQVTSFGGISMRFFNYTIGESVPSDKGPCLGAKNEQLWVGAISRIRLRRIKKPRLHDCENTALKKISIIFMPYPFRSRLGP